jgi:hypothetical protein
MFFRLAALLMRSHRLAWQCAGARDRGEYRLGQVRSTLVHFRCVCVCIGYRERTASPSDADSTLVCTASCLPPALPGSAPACVTAASSAWVRCAALPL